MLDFTGLHCRRMVDDATVAAGSAANSVAVGGSATVVSAVLIRGDRLAALQWFCGLFCDGTTGALYCPAAAWNALWTDSAAASNTSPAFATAVDLAAAVWHWHVFVIAFGSKGNALAFQFILLLCFSSAVGGEYAALPSFIFVTLCSDIGIVCIAFPDLRWLTGSTVVFCITEAGHEN